MNKARRDQLDAEIEESRAMTVVPSWADRPKDESDDDYDPHYGDTETGGWIGAVIVIVCLLGAATIIVWAVCKGRCF